MSVKKRAKDIIDRLSENKVRLILDFIEYLEEKEAWEATEEILSIKGMMEDIREAEKDLREEKMENFIPWDKVKKNSDIS
ncbi:MAG TPA: hypothetical protein ENL39_06175 [Candidatus Aerophobetes bacterium]|uniref:DUF2281 domain-containing protein n=1 Tax=Aerophobetes bacterium TaxID=2030807 RepID=A0A7V5I0W1_UNCAE|nr:hypothetical protein [Candidatus Aerophobetes bacterium]